MVQWFLPFICTCCYLFFSFAFERVLSISDLAAFWFLLELYIVLFHWFNSVRLFSLCCVVSPLSYIALMTTSFLIIFWFNFYFTFGILAFGFKNYAIPFDCSIVPCIWSHTVHDHNWESSVTWAAKVLSFLIIRGWGSHLLKKAPI